MTPKGGKLWRMDYGFDRKRKCLSIGPYPLVSLVEAREKRDDARRLLAEGKDPSVVKKLRIQENIESARMTFEGVAREWHEANKPQWAKVHAAEVIRTLERDVFPRIGTLPIRDLTPPKVLEVLRAIENRSAIETAKRIRQRISTIYAYAIASGLADSDPAEKVGAALKPLPKKGRQPAITDIAGLRGAARYRRRRFRPSDHPVGAEVDRIDRRAPWRVARRTLGGIRESGRRRATLAYSRGTNEGRLRTEGRS